MEGGHSAKQSFHQPYRDYERNRAEHYAALGFVRSAPKAIENTNFDASRSDGQSRDFFRFILCSLSACLRRER